MENDKKLPQFGHLPKKAISWRAIFGGLVTVFAILLVLNLIGVAIGFSTIEPTEEANPLSGLGIGTVIWWIVANLIALFVGGRVAARAGVSFTTKGGIMQGFLTWALYCVLSYLLIASAVGKIISGVGSIVMETAVMAGEALVSQSSQDKAKVADGGTINWQQAKSEFFALLEDTEKKALDPDRLESQAENVVETAEERGVEAAKDPATINQEVNKVFDKAEREFAESIEALDREALVNLVVNRTDLSREKAGKVVDNYIETYEEIVSGAETFIDNAKEEINEQAEAAAEAVAKAAMYVSITLILGMIVAVLGGFMGVRSLRNEYRDQVGEEYS